MPRRLGLISLTILILFLAYSHASATQWLTIQTEHFVLHYPAGYEEIARQAAAMAEDIHPKAVEAVGYEPRGKTQIALTDSTDLANGFTRWSYFNGMKLYTAPFSDASMLGSGFARKYDSWLYSLILHEYIHVLHMDMNYGVPAALRSVYGRLPIFTNLNAMQTFAWIEGMAVYHESHLAKGGRSGDPLFEMFLRANVLDANLPEIDQILGYYDLKEWQPAGNVYLYGSALVEYIAQTYGPETLQKINKTHAGQAMPSLGWAIYKVLGKSLNEVWGQCQDWLMEKHGATLARTESAGVVEGERVTYSGERTMGPVYLPTGDGLIYQASSRNSFTALRWRDGQGQERKLFSPYGSLSARAATSADGREIIYSEMYTNSSERQTNDLVSYDIRTGQKQRLTRGARAVDPALSPDGRSIAYIQIEPYDASLVLLDRETGEKRTIPLPEEVDGLGEPAFSPDGSRIAFTALRQGGWQDLAVINSDGTGLGWLTSDEAADFSPSWDPQGQYIYYSSDRSGIFDIYAYDLTDGSNFRLTRVRTGAFQPTVSPDGNSLVYTGYTSEGYDLYQLPMSKALWSSAEVAVKEYAQNLPEAMKDIAVSETKSYSPWPTLAPKYWLPQLNLTTDEAYFLVQTSGEDALGRDYYTLSAGWDISDGQPLVDLDYQHKYGEFGPVLNLGYSNLEESEFTLGLSRTTGRYTIFSRGMGVKMSKSEGQTQWEKSLTYNVGLQHQNGDGPWSLINAGLVSGEEFIDEEARYIVGQAVSRLAYQQRTKLSADLAYGWAKGRVFDLGGASGVFAVRGLPQEWDNGDQIMAGSLNYRPWELRIERGYGDIPIFFNSLAIEVFVDAGAVGDSELGPIQYTAGAEINTPVEMIYGIGGAGFGSGSTLTLRAGYAVPLNRAGEGQIYFAANLPLLGF